MERRGREGREAGREGVREGGEGGEGGGREGGREGGRGSQNAAIDSEYNHDEFVAYCY